MYSYENATGRLQREAYPNGSYVEYTYYGSANPSQVGFVWKVEHKRSDGSLLIGYEYSYDLLGRVVQSVERPSGDTTVYTYTPAGRLASEVRTGQVAYSRSYGYNPDGSRAEVSRSDALNGTHWDIYFYEAASGRLQSVLDVWSGEVNEFVWNPEGMLISLRVNNLYLFYEYNETLQLISIRFCTRANLPTTIASYEYNSDGQLVHITDLSNGWEFRLSCGLACRYPFMRAYGRRVDSERYQTLVSLLQNDGRTVSLHRTFRENDTIIDEILWVHYSVNGIAALTDQSGELVARSGDGGHCERLKEKLLSLHPSGCKSPFGLFPCPLPPDDCRRFNDLLYRFCYECKNNPAYMVDCNRFAEWYYKYSGCKQNAPHPGSPLLPPPVPGYPVAPPPSSPSLPTPSPCRGDRCNIPEITSPSSPPREPCPIHNPEGYFICKFGITDNPTSCARVFNGLRQGAVGNDMCLDCCDIAARYYGWSAGRLVDCRNACMVLNPY